MSKKLKYLPPACSHPSPQVHRALLIARQVCLGISDPDNPMPRLSDQDLRIFQAAVEFEPGWRAVNAMIEEEVNNG